MGARRGGARVACSAAAVLATIGLAACSNPSTSAPTSASTSTSTITAGTAPGSAGTEPIASEPPATDCPTTPPRLPEGFATTTTDPNDPEASAPADNRAPLVALDPATGAERWRVCPGPWTYSDVVAVDDLLVVRGRSFELAGEGAWPCGAPAEPVLLVLSAATGAVMWATDDQLAWGYNEDPPVPDVTAGIVVVEDGDVVRAFAVADGAPVWEADGSSSGAGDPVIVVAEGAEPRAHDRRTGELVPVPADPRVATRRRQVGDQVALTGADGTAVQVGDGSVTARGSDGATRWRVEAPPFVAEVRGVSDDAVVVAGTTRVGNCP